MRSHIIWEKGVLTLYNDSKGLQSHHLLVLLEYRPKHGLGFPYGVSNGIKTNPNLNCATYDRMA